MLQLCRVQEAKQSLPLQQARWRYTDDVALASAKLPQKMLRNVASFSWQAAGGVLAAQRQGSELGLRRVPTSVPYQAAADGGKACPADRCHCLLYLVARCPQAVPAAPPPQLPGSTPLNPSSSGSQIGKPGFSNVSFARW